jgi:chromate transporter
MFRLGRRLRIRYRNEPQRNRASSAGRSSEGFAAFLRLAVSAFGSPVVHLAYYRQEFVLRRRWLDEEASADVVALCQFPR